MQAAPTNPDKLRLGQLAIGLYVVLPMLLVGVIGREDPLSFLLLPAGPWAARLLGHSCGVIDFAPMVGYGLLAFGALSLALGFKLGRWPGWIPLGLWWPAWVLCAVISVINASE